MTSFEYVAYTVKQTDSAKYWLESALLAESKEEFLWKISEVLKSLQEANDKAKQEHSSRAFGSGD
jgi:hypothetical protein